MHCISRLAEESEIYVDQYKIAMLYIGEFSGTYLDRYLYFRRLAISFISMAEFHFYYRNQFYFPCQNIDQVERIYKIGKNNRFKIYMKKKIF